MVVIRTPTLCRKSEVPMFDENGSKMAATKNGRMHIFSQHPQDWYQMKGLNGNLLIWFPKTHMTPKNQRCRVEIRTPTL